MILEASVVIRRSPEDVWAYLGNPANVSAWDRGVAGVETAAGAPPGVGFTFDTLARAPRAAKDQDWGRMSYRIAEVDEQRGCTVQLTSQSGNARFFKTAAWRFRVVPEAGGSRVFCAADFRLRWQYWVLAPVFWSMKRAIRADLESLRRVLENQSQPLTPAAS